MNVIGIDPGLNGAVAIIHDGVMSEVVDLPTVPVRYGKKTRDELSAALFHELLLGWGRADIIVIEQVQSSPQMGATSAFRFGEGYGTIRAIASTRGSPVLYVRPQEWKKFYGLGRDKAASRSVAIDRFPDHAKLFARAKDEGRAEAALIALWGWTNGK